MAKRKTVVCFGTGPAFKGGMANYNTSLAKTLAKQEEVDVHIVSWTQQYPSIVPRDFMDKVSKVDFLEGTNISCTYITNYNNPFTWKKTVDFIASLRPDIVLFQWSIALQGLPLGRIIKGLKSACSWEVIADLHFVIQKEQSKIDTYFTKIGIKHADTYIVHCLQTYVELQQLFPKKKFFLTESGERSATPQQATVIKLFHPIYDLFKPDRNFDIEKFKKDNNLKGKVLLFFGFIRKYKGLHHVIESFNLVAKEREDVTLLICGESFWNTLSADSIVTKFKKATFGFLKKVLMGAKDDEQNYQPLALIPQLGLDNRVVVFNQYIPNEEVHRYFQVSDCVVLYYLTASSSGIESMSYNFDLPILATRVGHFPETVQEGVNGYLAEPEDIRSMADTMIKFLDRPLLPENVSVFKKNFTWEVYVHAILNDTKTKN